jgi:FkbH-like protein
VWLATRVRVRSGAVIGAGSVISAGSEVVGEIPPNVIAAGVPARVLGPRDLGAKVAKPAIDSPPSPPTPPRTPVPVDTAAPEAAPAPAAAPTPAAAPAHRGLLVADFSIQELAQHLRYPDPLGPTLDAEVAPFDQVVPTLLAIDGWVTDKHVDFAVIWLRPEGIGSFRRLRLGESVPLEEILAEVDAFAERLRKAAASVPHVFVASFARQPDVRGLGMIDLRPGGITHALLRMNERLAEAVAPTSNVYVLDAQRWIDAAGRNAVDDKLWYLAKVGYSPEVLAEAARDVRAGLRGALGGAKKLIVLDLDETLWGGILGDVGWEGLRLGGHDAVGEAYVDFQRELKALSRRGILLAIVSKNTESVALEALEKHPEMVLRREDFCAIRINWRDKAANVAELATALNLGLQSMVFIDDNPAERARVHESIPEVFVPDWPKEPFAYAHALRALRCFDVPAVSREDAARTALYASEHAREELRAKVGSLDEWLGSLGLVLRFAPLGDENLTRTSQLLNKTNQMNLATRRLAEAELRAWANAPGHEVWALSVSDRIGDSGLTGILSLELDGDTLRIADFILSCRVMGRRIEEAMAAAAVSRARALGARAVEAAFRETSKNKPCREFWEQSGFAHDAATDVYRLESSGHCVAPAFLAIEGLALDTPAATLPPEGDHHV